MIREPVVIGGTRGYRLRHVGPQSAIWTPLPAAISVFSVLNQSLISRPLHQADVAGAPAFANGQWTGRLGDAGDGNVIFPNSIASDAIPWRDRFDETGRNQWLEVYNDGYLESTLCITSTNKQEESITVGCNDSFSLCKNAFERDLVVVQAPRDVFERATMLWVPTVVDNFPPAGGVSGQWAVTQSGGGTVTNMASPGSPGTILSVPASSSTSNNVLKGAGTGADSNVSGALTWANPGRITKSDQSYAKASNPSTSNSQLTHVLKATNFGFNVPNTATINGVVVKVQRVGVGFILDNLVQLVKGGALSGSNKSTGALWTGSSEATATYGGSSDLWGNTLTPADVNSSNFGVGFQALVGASGFPNQFYAEVDYISVTVYYTYTPPNPIAGVTGPVVALNSATGVWKSSSALYSSSSTGLNGFDGISHSVTEDTDVYLLATLGAAGVTVLELNGTIVGVLTPDSQASYNMLLESDGENVFGFINGQLVGCIRRGHSTTTSLQTSIQLAASSSGKTATVTLANTFTKALQAFLMPGTDRGDYVLPGDATTYPSGGLHARYFNDLDLQSDVNRLIKIQTPPRTQAYGGGGSAQEYANQQDANINSQAPPSPGTAGSGWSALWFGSIYLKLSAGNYSFSVTLPAHANNQAVRVWIGKTQFGAQLLDQWNFTNTSGQVYTFTLTAAALAGTLSAGGGTVQRDGWYPIKIAYAVDGTTANAPVFKLTSSPTAYTDPGGTAIASGSQTTVVPATSLSPLGCVDQRFQGISHFDMAQQVAQAADYQFAVEPQRLESGLFPGVMVPRIREGNDSDIITELDKDSRGEALLNASVIADASDSVASLQGNGAGFQNGNSGQLQAEVFDTSTLQASLFAIEGWQDFSDASFGTLLQALLNSQLGLRLAPWQLVSGDPVGRERISHTWPLPGNLMAMRWRPGDGLRLRARELSLYDTSPRQLLTVQRQFVPGGVTGTSVGWANRPRGATRAMRQLFYATTRKQRNYQGQSTTLTGEYVTGLPIPAGGTSSQGSTVSLQPGETVVRAILRVNYNSGNLSFNVLLNGSDVTASLNGPWSKVPALIDATAVAGPDSNNQISAALTNNGAAAGLFSWQLLVEVTR